MIALASASATCVRTLLSLRALIRVPFVFNCFPLLDFAGTAIDAVTINGGTCFRIATATATTGRNVGFMILRILLSVANLLMT